VEPLRPSQGALYSYRTTARACAAPHTERRLTDFPPPPPQVHRQDGSYYWLLGTRHACTACKCSFNSYDAGAMAKMPRAVQESLPCYVTHKCAIDKKYLDYIRTAAPQGVAFESIARTAETQAGPYTCSLFFQLFKLSLFYVSYEVERAIQLTSNST
jgi:hypothetical protein